MNAEETTSGPEHRHLFLGRPKDGFITEDEESLIHAHDGDDLHHHQRRFLLYPTSGKGPLVWYYGAIQTVPQAVETY